MHVYTHLKPSSQGKTGLGIYPDGMVEHDGMVGELLKLVDDLGVANNTIVVYTTDNGAEVLTWPDGGATPFKGEKAKAYGVHCQGESKKHVKGEKGTPFSQCVTAMAKAATNDDLTPRQACKGSEQEARERREGNAVLTLRGRCGQAPQIAQAGLSGAPGMRYWSPLATMLAVALCVRPRAPPRRRVRAT